MELVKCFESQGFCREIHSGWYKQKLHFQVFLYEDGTERITVYDHSTNQEIVLLDLAVPKDRVENHKVP
jgi:hypothetical protein